jgi:hypothetical protein
MKSLIAKAAVLLVAGFVVLSAAMPSQTLMRANIPFAFLAGDQMHPAGEYWVQVNPEFRYVSLRPLDGATAQWAALNGSYVPRTGRELTKGFLQFERYESTYALRAVGIPEAKAGFGVMPSRAEKELKAHGAAARVEISLLQ